jgi:two-component sensor histidine kinase
MAEYTLSPRDHHPHRTSKMRQAAARVVAWTVDRWTSLWTTGLRPGSSSGIAFALACVCLATAIRVLLGEVGPESTVFAPYYAATVVIALVCGWTSAAISALAGGILASLLFLLPDQDPARGPATIVVSVGLYSASSFVIIWSAESYRRLTLLLQEADKVRSLLSNELVHRLKNTLTVVQTVIRYSINDQPELRNKLCARVAALADTNEILIHAQDNSSFLQLIDRELTHFGRSRVHVSGPDFSCKRETLTLLSLLIHELATNAAKYGALATATGSLHLEWSLVSGRLDLMWRERGVTGLSAPGSKGFGSKLLDAVAKRFNGSVHVELASDGLTCRLTLQLFEPDHSDPGRGRDHKVLAFPSAPAAIHSSKSIAAG